ncbi:MAG: TIR domain-containing protein, partial [Pseudomonadota bacterium]
LGDALESAIQASEDLIVIASPHSAQSKWVNEEVLHFKKLADPNKQVFAVVLDGTPHATSDTEECFVPALRYKIGADGSLSATADEPLAPDARKESFKRLVTKIAAGLEELPFDDLWQRQKRQARNRILASLGVIAAITAPFAIWGAMTTNLLQARTTELASLDTATQEQNFKDAYFVALQDRQWVNNTPEDYLITREQYEDGLDILLATDANGDGYQDYFARIEFIDFCGAAGCLHEIMVYDEGVYRPVHQSNGGDLQVVSTLQNGFRDLALGFGGLEQGATTYTMLRYDGTRYVPEAYALCSGASTYCGLSTVFTDEPSGETQYMVFDAVSADAQSALTERIDPGAIYARLLPDGSLDEESPYGEYDEIVGLDRSGDYALLRVWKTTYGVTRLRPEE